MEIRRMIAQDIANLALLYRQFWGEDSYIELMERKFLELQNNPYYILLSAVEGQQLIGSILGIICEELYGECKPFLVIEDLVVDQKYRRRGVGKALMAEVEKVAIDRGCYQVLFITENDRLETISFYESLGFNAKTHIGFKKSLKKEYTNHDINGDGKIGR